MTIDPESLMKQIDEEVNILVLVTGELADGGAHYAYVSIPPSKYDAFKAAEAQGNYDLARFGKILAHGAGSAPPESVAKEMEEKYGANHRFEEELEELTQRLQAALLEKKKAE